MPDVTGYRAKVAVIVPSTNTVVEHDLALMRLPGITNHTGRMYISDPQLGSDASFEALVEQLDASLDIAIRDAMTTQPDYLMMGMSAMTFWGGVEGSKAFDQRVHNLTGLHASTGSTSCAEGLRAIGARRIAIVSPYQPVADENVTRFFEESGFDVVRFHGLRCPTATAIAAVTEEHLIGVLRDLDGADIDAIVQVGTNLSMVRLADEAERWLGKPVLAINATVLWHSLRAMGYSDQIRGAGILLREH